MTTRFYSAADERITLDPHATWFMSDLHLGHARIIDYTKRPFASVDHMNDALIAALYERVRPSDTLVLLGDLTFEKDDQAAETLLSSLPGAQKILVRGNHDSEAVARWSGWSAVADLLQVRIKHAGRTWPIVMCHYPLDTWRARHHGGIHLHGHTHGRGNDFSIWSEEGELKGGRLDMSVEAWSYRPASLQGILARLKKAPSRAALEGPTRADL